MKENLFKLVRLGRIKFFFGLFLRIEQIKIHRYLFWHAWVNERSVLMNLNVRKSLVFSFILYVVDSRHHLASFAGLGAFELLIVQAKLYFFFLGSYLALCIDLFVLFIGKAFLEVVDES
jgi:uncharacterized membrane protein YesL